MAYDKESRTISVTGDPGPFEEDLLLHYEEVARQTGQGLPESISHAMKQMADARCALAAGDQVRRILDETSTSARGAHAQPTTSTGKPQSATPSRTFVGVLRRLAAKMGLASSDKQPNSKRL